MILTHTDKPIYFPDVPLEGDALSGAILRAQYLAESPKGANRSFSIRQYVSQFTNVQGTVFLSYLPVIELVSIEGKARGGFDNWGRPIPITNEWQPIEEYELNEQTGELTFSELSFTHIKVTYTSGFDLDGQQAEVNVIKSCVAHILDFQNSAIGMGIKRLGNNDLEFVEAVPPGVVPEDLLKPLWQFRPRR